MKKKLIIIILVILYSQFTLPVTFYISSRFVIFEFIKISSHIHSYFGRTPRTVIYAGGEKLHSIIVLI